MLLVFSFPSRAEASPACGQPSIVITTTGAGWASYQDYLAGILSVDFNASNLSGPDAQSVWIVGAVSNKGVTLASPGYLLGNMPQGAASRLTLKYNIPAGVTSFRTAVYAQVTDACGVTYDIPKQYPLTPGATIQQWRRPAFSFLDGQGMHIYSGTTNRLANPLMSDADGNGAADGWGTWSQNGKYAAEFSVDRPAADQPGEQVIRLRSTSNLITTDWFGLYMRQNDPATKWAFGTDVRIDWLPGTTDAEKNALSDLTIGALVFGYPSTSVVTKADIGAGWRRTFTNSLHLAPSQDFYTQFRCRTSVSNWHSANGGLEIRFRKPQLENTLTERGFACTTPPALPVQPGVTVDGSGAVSRGVGYAQVGYTVTDGIHSPSPFQVDTSQDWGFFVEWTADQDAREILPNDNEWQIANFDDHWDAPGPVHDEVHMDIDGSATFPGENRLIMLTWDTAGSQNDWLFDSVNLNPYIRMGDVCRAAYWKAGSRHYEKLNVYRNGSLVISRMASQPLTAGGMNMGLLKQVTLGNDHRVNVGQTHAGNSTFRHISAEQTTLNEAGIDSFLTTGARPQNASTIFWWDLSTGSDQVLVKNNA